MTDTPPWEGDVPPLALTEAHLPALAAAVHAEGYRIVVDTETGEVKLERAQAPWPYPALGEIMDRLSDRDPRSGPLRVEYDLWKRGLEDMKRWLESKGLAPVPFVSAEADAPNFLVAGVPIMILAASV